MDYDIVIATRNRPNALRMSLPLIAQQTRQPKTLIVIDSSDRSDVVDAVLAECLPDTGFKVVVEKPGRANLAYQRNLGVTHVTAPVTMFPDDDSLWFPDTAEAVMAVYEQDRGEQIGGVSGMPVTTSPLAGHELQYDVDRVSVLKTWLSTSRNRVEDLLFEPPYRFFGRNLPAYKNPAPSIVAGGWPVVATMTGFRMSYRTDLLRDRPFDEVLGHKTGYCLFEDILMSLQVASVGRSLVVAPKARVFHHVFPSARANGFDYGFSHVGNYIYVCCRVMPRSKSIRRKLDNFLRFKLALYRMKRSPYWREVYRGALAAYRSREALWNAPPEQLADAFRSVCDANPSPPHQTAGGPATDQIVQGQTRLLMNSQRPDGAPSKAAAGK